MNVDEKVQPSRFLLGCILIPVLLCAVFFALSTVGFALALVFTGPKGPFGGKIGLGIFSVVFDGLLAWFFATVARRMIAAMRGRNVPHLFPPIVGVVVGGLVGLGCVATGIAGIAGEHHGSGTAQAFPIGVLFLGYAGHRARAWWRHRRTPQAEPEP
jgi:hypothetical protein